MTIVIPGVITVSFLSLFYCCMMPEVGRKDRLEAFEKQYIAHRGFHDNASFNPENTMPAFEKAVEKEYGIELDVQLTKDRPYRRFRMFCVWWRGEFRLLSNSR